MVDICNRDKDLINYLYDAINYNHIKIYCINHINFNLKLMFNVLNNERIEYGKYQSIYR